MHLFLVLAFLPYVLVLRDGSHVQAKAAPQLKGSIILYQSATGVLTSIPKEQLDESATAKANAPGTPTPSPTPASYSGLHAAAKASGPPKTISNVPSTSGAGPTSTPSKGTLSVTSSSSPATDYYPTYSGSSSAGKSVSVSGYTTKSGTYVAPYTRAAPGQGAKKH